jgi:streptomycin 6-kinase
MRLPDGVLGMVQRGPGWAAWVEALPALVRGLYDEWELRPDGWMMHGYCALVVPVVTAGGRRAMLKVSYPEEETEHEHLALSHWGGRGAVPLLRADPRRRALLLEALRDVSLREAWDVEACNVVADLYGRLHVPAPPQLRRLTDVATRAAAALGDLPRSAPVPRRLVEQAVSLSADLAIDPKPLSGDPHYEVAPMLWNRFEELAGDVRGGVRRRFHTLVDVAGLDEDRARDWVVVRMMDNAVWELAEAQRVGRRPEEDWLTTMITVAKAVQD